MVIESAFKGFCKGIERALGIYESARRESEDTYLSALICHNRDVCLEYGVRLIGERTPPYILVVGAHGMPLQSLQEHKRRKGVKIISAVCPVVEKNLAEISRLDRKNPILYLGKPGHDEAEAVRSRFRENDFFITGENDVKSLASLGKIGKGEVELMVQTSFSDEAFLHVTNALAKSGVRFYAFGGICLDCMRRRRDVELLSASCDAVVVAGDPGSANAIELARRAKQKGCDAFVIMNGSEAEREMAKGGALRQAASIGLISSASSGKGQFEQIRRALELGNG